MFSIGRHPSKPPQDVIDMLFACHDRIRRLGLLAGRLPRAQDVARTEVEQAARELLAYFGLALPLHVADEDLSIRPRLHEVASSEEVREALAKMTEQHEAIDATLASLMPHWEILRGDGSRLASMPASFTEDSRVLREALEGHLAMEEETVFPAMRRDLSAESEAVILREMRERRLLHGLEMPTADPASS